MSRSIDFQLRAGARAVVALLGTLSPALLLGASEAVAHLEIASINCPTTAAPGSVPLIDIDLRGTTPDPVDVQLSAGYAVTGNSTLFGQTFIGPVMAAPDQFLGAFETRLVSLDSAPPLPTRSHGTVVEFFVISRSQRFGSDSTVKTKGCLIALPEPGFASSIAGGMFGLAIAMRRRRRIEGRAYA